MPLSNLNHVTASRSAKSPRDKSVKSTRRTCVTQAAPIRIGLLRGDARQVLGRKPRVTPISWLPGGMGLVKASPISVVQIRWGKSSLFASHYFLDHNFPRPLRWGRSIPGSPIYWHPWLRHPRSHPPIVGAAENRGALSSSRQDSALGPSSVKRRCIAQKALRAHNVHTLRITNIIKTLGHGGNDTTVYRM